MKVKYNIKDISRIIEEYYEVLEDRVVYAADVKNPDTTVFKMIENIEYQGEYIGIIRKVSKWEVIDMIIALLNYKGYKVNSIYYVDAGENFKLVKAGSLFKKVVLLPFEGIVVNYEPNLGYAKKIEHLN